MISGFLVKKGQMTSIFTEDGKRIAVTKCVAKPLIVTQIKNQEKDGYQAVQVAYGQRKRLDQSTSSKLNKLKIEGTPKGFQEFFLTSDQIPEVGSNISIDTIFTVGEKVDITGISKGRGFAGVIKRHGFKKQPLLGASDRVRHPGSIGAQTPGKVVRGKKMPGHMGNVNKTVENLKIVSINPENNEILISGSFPGHFNSWITITKV
ncbi:MAG: 50S ribosomal protein L3 [Candidatus Shapirobacteria bacterium]|nr:50S ribosomal protein L3 [Candidatus Shapirobacteria bacterium]MDD3003196.1 50S ribosomal protein L3 [Candidatus Shapirobacteria bacterium]MDD4383082.1 50S ribosomal protein L3 [Candidatus Shapirobacteria bacterium]